MAVKFGKVLPLLLLLATSMFAIAAANAKAKQTSNRIVVGGSENWRFGFNYTGWAIKNGPFYLSDTLGDYDLEPLVEMESEIVMIQYIWSFTCVLSVERCYYGWSTFVLGIITPLYNTNTSFNYMEFKAIVTCNNSSLFFNDDCNNTNKKYFLILDQIEVLCSGAYSISFCCQLSNSMCKLFYFVRMEI